MQVAGVTQRLRSRSPHGIYGPASSILDRIIEGARIASICRTGFSRVMSTIRGTLLVQGTGGVTTSRDEPCIRTGGEWGSAMLGAALPELQSIEKRVCRPRRAFSREQRVRTEGEASAELDAALSDVREDESLPIKTHLVSAKAGNPVATIVVGSRFAETMGFRSDQHIDRVNKTPTRPDRSRCEDICRSSPRRFSRR